LAGVSRPVDSSAGADAPDRPPAAPAASGAAAERPLRRDAERNRRRILDAAAAVFAERGLGVTMDDIAHRAGVGVGTVYRRFPDKEELIDALFVDRIEAMATLAEQGLAHDDPWEGLVWFMEQALLEQARDRGLKELLFGAARGHGGVSHARERMAPVVIELFDRARASGQLRDDVEGVDTPVLQLMVGTVLDFARDVEPELWRRFLVIVLDGLRARRDGRTPLPVPPLREDDLEKAMATWKDPRRR
jgi:AcrR family transcriptional regulator